MTTSSSPASSVCVYKLFSSCRVWSRTWCMPRFSSLACDSFSGEKKKKYDTVNPQSPVSSARSFHATVISSWGLSHSTPFFKGCTRVGVTGQMFCITGLVKLCHMQKIKINHYRVPFMHKLLAAGRLLVGSYRMDFLKGSFAAQWSHSYIPPCGNGIKIYAYFMDIQIRNYQSV